MGLGDLVNRDFKDFGEETGPRTRSAMLDESLEIIAGLQSGQLYQFSGKHYQVAETVFLPPPVQTPHVPIWVSAHTPFKRPLRRAARWDGVLPRRWSAGPITPAAIREIAKYVAKHRTIDTPFDIIKYGVTDGKDPAKDKEEVREFEAAGVT